MLTTSVGQLRVGHVPQQPQGAAVVATVRPEHIDLLEAGSHCRGNCFTATIESAVYYGGILSYQLRAGELSLQVKDRSTRRFAPGEEVLVRLNPDHLWVFPEVDAEAGVAA